MNGVIADNQIGVFGEAVDDGGKKSRLYKIIVTQQPNIFARGVLNRSVEIQFADVFRVAKDFQSGPAGTEFLQDSLSIIGAGVVAD